MSSTSGYMGEKYFQEFGPRFLSCPQLVGTWVQNIFRNLVPDFLAHTPWRIPPYEKYPRKGVLARGHVFAICRQLERYILNTLFQESGPICLTQSSSRKVSGTE